jgi:hypothetical protein
MLRDRSALLFCAVLAVAALPAVASAASEPGKMTYTGTLDCTANAFMTAPLHAKITVIVSGMQATYSRDVFSPARKEIVGQETGTGTLATNGDVTLKGGWQSAGSSRSSGQPAWDIEGSYSGNLGTSGGSLSGKQTSTVNGQTYDRTCTIALAKPQAGDAASSAT